mmetsp:Transcript_6040/g.20231  ORF Transcript_6040/g.20231 Transcript_6040/m.20231 type:complete len:314 (-) Transcript_6040:347-1288(-)
MVDLDAAEGGEVEVEPLERHGEDGRQPAEPAALERVPLAAAMVAVVCVVSAQLLGLEQVVEAAAERVELHRRRLEGAHRQGELVKGGGARGLAQAGAALHELLPLAAVELGEGALLRRADELRLERVEEHAQQLLHVVLREGIRGAPPKRLRQLPRVYRSHRAAAARAQLTFACRARVGRARSSFRLGQGRIRRLSVLHRHKEPLQLRGDAARARCATVLASLALARCSWLPARAPLVDDPAELGCHVQRLQQRGEVARGALVDQADKALGIRRRGAACARAESRQSLRQACDGRALGGVPQRNRAQRLGGCA